MRGICISLLVLAAAPVRGAFVGEHGFSEPESNSELQSNEGVKTEAAAAENPGGDPIQNIQGLANTVACEAAAKGVAGPSSSAAQQLKVVAAKAERAACSGSGGELAPETDDQEEHQFEEEEKAVEKEFEVHCAAALKPYPAANVPDSPAAQKAKAAGVQAKKLSEDYVLAETEAKKSRLVAAAKKKKADIYKDKAAASYRKAATDAANLVRAKVGVAAAAASAISCSTGGGSSSKLQELTMKEKKAEQEEMEAIKQQKEIMQITQGGAEAKAKSDCESKAAAAASAKLATDATAMIAEIDANMATGAHGGCSDPCPGGQ